MKIFIIAVVALIFGNQLYSQEFDYEKLHFDLVGVTHANGKIVAYGYSGHVLVSTDKGENWTSVKIFEDDKNITKMIYSENNFYGICFEGIIFKTDFDLNLTNQTSETLNYYDFDIGNNLYVVTSYNAVKVFDFNLEFIKEIPVESTNVVSQISAFNEHLYLPKNSGKIVDISLNDNDLVSIIDVSSVGNSIRQIIPTPNSLILNIDNIATEFDIETKNIKQLTGSVNLLHFYSNNLYDLQKKANNTKNVAWLELYKFNNGDFELVTQDSIDRYVTPNLNISDYLFLNSNDIIAVGNNKTICISNSGGVNWEFKSHLNANLFKKWINDKIGFAVCTQGQICKTINGGITWLPQIYTDTLIRFTQVSGSLESAFYMNVNGQGFYWFTTGGMMINDSTKIFNTLYTDDFGETYNCIWDWGFKGKYMSRVFASQFQVEMIDFNNSIIASIVPQIGDITKNNLTYIFDIDPIHQNSKSIKLDSISIIGITNYEDKLYALMWERRYPSDDIPFWYDSTKHWIASSIDKGNNWNFEFACSMDSHLNGFYRYKKDNIILFEPTHNRIKINNDSGFTPFSLFYIDVKTKLSKLIYNDTSYFNDVSNYKEAKSQLLMLYKDYIYIRTKNYDIIKCNIIDINSPKWEKTQLLVNDSLFYPINFHNDSILYSGNYKYHHRKPTTVDENQIENGGEPKIFSGKYFNIYPNPANDFITIKFQTSEVLKTSEVYKVQIFDMLGIEIISESIHPMTGSHRMNIERLSSGVYFIRIGDKVEKFVKM